MMVHAQWLLMVSPFPPLGPIRLSMFCFMLTGADTSEVRLPECRRHNHGTITDAPIALPPRFSTYPRRDAIVPPIVRLSSTIRYS